MVRHFHVLFSVNSNKYFVSAPYKQNKGAIRPLHNQSEIYTLCTYSYCKTLLENHDLLIYWTL